MAGNRKNSVQLTMEPIIELKIREVALDGREHYILPRTQSENLVHQASRIDFSEEKDEKQNEMTVSTDGSEAPVAQTDSSQHWPLEDVRSSIRSALTEVSVLSDMLRLSRDKNHVALDPIIGQAPIARPSIQLLNKRRALSAASEILQRGAQYLRNEARLRNSNPTSAPEDNFHHQLLLLRQRWKLKKVNNVITGDLGYTSVGSQYSAYSTFEVHRNTKPAIAGEPPSCPLEVRLDSRLEGTAYVLVLVRKMPDCKDLSSAMMSLPDLSSDDGTNTSEHWQHKLMRAQNIVFCDELFARLKTDAVEMKQDKPIVCMENHIIVTLFPDIQLTISLQHDAKSTKPERPPRDRDRVLEHALHALLRAQHRDNIIPAPMPASATATPKHRRGVGVGAKDMEYLANAIQPRILLDDIIRYAQHAVVKKRVLTMLEGLSRSVQDPQLHVHLSSISSATHSTFRVSLVSSGYDFHPNRTMLSVVVEDQTVRVTQRDGTIVQLSYDPQQLRSFINVMMCQHQVMVVRMLAQQMNWKVVGMYGVSGCSSPQGPSEAYGSAAGIILTTASGERYVGIRCGPTSGNQVFVQSRDDASQNLEASFDDRWKFLNTSSRQVDMDHLEGKNFVGKIELLLSSFSKPLK